MGGRPLWNQKCLLPLYFAMLNRCIYIYISIVLLKFAKYHDFVFFSLSCHSTYFLVILHPLQQDQMSISFSTGQLVIFRVNSYYRGQAKIWGSQIFSLAHHVKRLLQVWKRVCKVVEMSHVGTGRNWILIPKEKIWMWLGDAVMGYTMCTVSKNKNIFVDEVEWRHSLQLAVYLV